MSEVKKAMIFTAGLGTRLKPITDHIPKALVPVNGVPLLERNIKYLAQYGVHEFVINVHHFAEKIVSFLAEKNNFGYTIHISDETDEVLETGGGLKKAADFFDHNPFVVMNVDILTNLNLANLISFHLKGDQIASLAVSDRLSSRKLLFDKNDYLCGWKNTLTGETRLSTENKKDIFIEKSFNGIHVISPKIFDMLPRLGKYSIIDPYLEIAKTHPIKAFDHTGDTFIDVGKHESLQEAEMLFL